MELLRSPWRNIFLDFSRSIEENATIVSPYISAQPLEEIAVSVQTPKSVQFNICTKLDSNSILHGSLDLNAIQKFCYKFPITTVKHLPGLHAKVYIADDHTAIITSGNLTISSLSRNLEYGIRVHDKETISQISDDIQQYQRFGCEISLQRLNDLCKQSNRMVKAYLDANDSNSAEIQLNDRLDRQRKKFQNSIEKLRGESGATITSIFSQTVLHVLKDGSLTTFQINLCIQDLHPDLCDDSKDRVINGVHFGKKWKHHVRNAQQALMRKNQILLIDGKWQLP
ncbi:MAG: phospholipase D family protein [Gammaproteobacteria bacterium]|nr:phospholipase D family protein [Gammaproteobacteria bacterium]